MAATQFMAGLLPAAFPAAGTVFQAFQKQQDDDKSRQQLSNAQAAERTLLERQQQAEVQEAARKDALERAEIAADKAKTEKERKDALARSLASARARAGASGISSDSGSAGAVLQNLVAQSDQDAESQSLATQMRLRALDEDMQTRKNRNLLEQQNLADRQALAWLNWR